MKRLMLKSMILKATVKQADVAYVGSITIDEDLIDRANLSVNESVIVVDRTNGRRLQTYVIRGERGSGMIGMNGAAAHLINEGDRIDVMSFTWSEGHVQPLFLEVDESNKFIGYIDEGEF
jgi:aspartate 1-decarboxylase